MPLGPLWRLWATSANRWKWSGDRLDPLLNIPAALICSANPGNWLFNKLHETKLDSKSIKQTKMSSVHLKFEYHLVMRFFPDRTTLRTAPRHHCHLSLPTLFPKAFHDWDWIAIRFVAQWVQCSFHTWFCEQFGMFSNVFVVGRITNQTV